MKKILLSLCLILSGCGTANNLYVKGPKFLVDPLGGWAYDVRKIEARTSDKPKWLDPDYDSLDLPMAFIDYPFTWALDTILLPITVPGNFIYRKWINPPGRYVEDK